MKWPFTKRSILTDPPADLLVLLEPYPHIRFNVVEEWGTSRLRDYLGTIMADARDLKGNARAGFPPAVSAALMQLSIANIEYLESIGLGQDDFVSSFAIPKWELPKNF